MNVEKIGEQEDVVLFFHEAMKKLHWAEKQILLLQQQMRIAAYSRELEKTITWQVDLSVLHGERVEQIFKEIEIPVEERVCEALKGILKDTREVILSTKRKTRMRDVGIISSLQRVVHYEMATYAVLIHLSTYIQWPRVAQLLEETLAEEKEAEIKLTACMPR
jgi:ferritin-like metal-binding protein YciE